jgi:hypothetical protein
VKRRAYCGERIKRLRDGRMSIERDGGASGSCKQKSFHTGRERGGVRPERIKTVKEAYAHFTPSALWLKEIH